MPRLRTDGGKLSPAAPPPAAGLILERDRNITSQVLTRRDEWAKAYSTAYVSSADELMEALSSDAGTVRVTGNIPVDGSLSVKQTLVIEDGASLINDNSVRFFHWNWQFVGLGGDVTNRGFMFLNSGERVDGVLNNSATAYAYDRSAGYQGSWTGRALQYR